MFFITLFLSGVLFSPFKDSFKDFANHPPISWGKVVSATIQKNEDTNSDSQNAVLQLNGIELNKLPEIPRPKADDKKNNLIVWAKKAVMIDADTGKVLYDEKMLEDHHIASITKTMTALVLMDKVKDWDENVKISPYAASAGGATVHFLSGEKFKAIDLLKAMLMNSDNTAARALAEHFAGGKEEDFAKMMNEKAKELHLKNSFFVDASGLNDDDSHSCAYDVAQIARKILDYPMILQIMQTPSHIQIVGNDEFQRVHQVGNTDVLLGQYKGILGSKTGFTYNAGYCLMMMREGPNQKKVIGVVLDAGDKERWIEMQKMLDWAFDRFSWTVFPNEKEK